MGMGSEVVATSLIKGALGRGPTPASRRERVLDELEQSGMNGVQFAMLTCCTQVIKLDTESDANLLIFRQGQIASEEIKLETRGVFECRTGEG